MDNSNNSNSTNPNPSATGSTIPPSTPDFSSPYTQQATPTPTWTPPASNPVNPPPPIQSYQSDTLPPASPWPSSPQIEPLAPNPTWTTPQAPTQPDLTNQIVSSPSNIIPSGWPSTPASSQPDLSINPSPISTENNPPAVQPPVAINNQSPLDNPWGSAQSPSLTATNQMPPQPATEDLSPSASTPGQSNWMNTTTNTNTPVNSNPTDNIPTDLSHLISSNNNQQEANQQPISTPETLVVSQANTVSPEIPTLPIEGHKGIPKWLIGVGIGLLIVVAGASAYFILGIGQPKNPTSIPAATQAPQPTVKNTPPVATPIPQPTQPAATGSANFGALGGNTQTPQATSAADLIRQRQQQASPKP